MTLLQLVSYLRTNILHDIGGTGVDWSDYSDTDFDSIQLRWTNEEIVSNINEAINQVYRRTQPIKDIITINTITNPYTPTYTLPSYVLEVLAVKKANGDILTEKSTEELYSIRDFNTINGELKNYTTDYQKDKIRFYPAPEVIETLELLVYRLPLTQLSWTTKTASPELREEFQIPMLYGAAAACYLKDEANTLDPSRSLVFTRMFDSEFPFTSSYSTIRKIKTSNRPIRYGGY